MKRDSDRREFLRDCGRGAVAAVLGLAGAILFARRDREGPSGKRCGRSGMCRGCGELERCGLPRALSLKQSETITPHPASTERLGLKRGKE